MLQAVVSGKAGRLPVGDGENAVSWRKAFRVSEDLLTASVFGRLAYLDGQMLWRILRKTFGSALPDFKVAELEDIKFWPRWNNESEDGCTVEPDVFLDLKLGDPAKPVRLIVEAKLGKHPAQEAAQWVKEWVAYQRTDDYDGQDLFLCALGGLGNRVDETVARITSEVAGLGHEIKAAGAGWDRLLDALEEERTRPLDRAVVRLIDDIITALGLADYQHLKLPGDIAVSSRPWNPLASATIKDFS